MNKIWTPKILLPSILTNDPRLAAAQHALEDQLEQLSKAARESIFLARLDDLPEHVLDLLAAQYHVDFYEPLGMDVEVKCEYIKDALLWHRVKGTAAAVERVLRRSFALSDVEEWFEYKGDEYFFRILFDVNSDDENADFNVMNRLRRAVLETKNARSWLDYYCFRFAQADPVASADSRFDTVKFDRDDFYDYRRQVILYDGAHSADGSCEVVSFQAADFERLTFDADINWHHPINVLADNLSNLFFTLRAEHQKTVDELDYAPILIADQPVKIEERSDLNATLDVNHAVEPDDHWQLQAEQPLTFNGADRFDGLVVANGSLIVEQTDRHPALDQWQALRDEIAASFDERCSMCGASEYSFGRSSIRLGGEHFLLTDPQWLTVQIRCRYCGALIAEYIVEDERMEVRL